MAVSEGLTKGKIDYFSTFMWHEIDLKFKEFKHKCQTCGLKWPDGEEFSKHVVCGKHSAYEGWWVCLKCKKSKKLKKKPDQQYRARFHDDLFRHLRECHYNEKKGEMSK